MFTAPEREDNSEEAVRDLPVHRLGHGVRAVPGPSPRPHNHHALVPLPTVGTCSHLPEDFLWPLPGML